MKNLLAENLFRTMLILGLATMFSSCSGDDEVGNGTIDPAPEEEVPIAVDDEYSTAENTVLDIEGLMDNDTVFDYARVTDFDASTEQGGSVEDNRDGTYIYTPPQDYIGEDSFEYTICDNASSPNCSSATVTINITEASPVAVDDAYETSEDSDLAIRNYLANDQLVDNATVSSVDAENANGTVILEENGDIRYSPSPGFSGVDSFAYTICDDDETPSCSTATITVTVTDEGSPVANNDVVVVDAGNAETIIDNLLENDDLTDDASLSSVDGSASQGTVVLNEDGSITYEPAAGFSGEDSFTYTLCDDDSPDPTCSTATVTVTVIEPLSFNIPSELEDYYEGLVLSDNEELNFMEVSQLTVENHTTILSYGQRHNYLYEADGDLDNPDNVILMYSGESRYWEEYTSGNNPYSPQTFNTEHIYPQSRLTTDDAVTDLHHLRVADAGINSLRLNHPYAEGSGEFGIVGDELFYPGDEWKGDVARMIMYLNIRYGEGFNRVGNLELFLEWNAEDPVSAFERQRNEVIEGAQGNRNPFIDNPYLATLIWGGEPAENTWE